MSEQSIPNFFIAGAPKAGTTSLYHHLSRHPDVYMSRVKEPSFFSLETRPENFVAEMRPMVQGGMEATRTMLDVTLEGLRKPGIVTRWDDYMKLFREASGQKVIGEGSVLYLWSKTAAREIAAMNPQSKIAIVLRHPAERAFSHYLHALSDAYVTHTFAQHIAEGLRSHGEIGLYYPFLECGMYSEQVERYLDCFPRNQVRIWLYQDTLSAPENFFREVLTFLGVDPTFTTDTTHRYHQMQIPKALGISQILRKRGVWKGLRDCVPKAMRPTLKKLVYRSRGSLTMCEEDRNFLVNYYRDDVRRLERVIERDLSAWMR